MVRDNGVCERGCVKDGVWQRCVWKMVCDCDKDKEVWQRCVWKMGGWRRRGGGGGEEEQEPGGTDPKQEPHTMMWGEMLQNPQVHRREWWYFMAKLRRTNSFCENHGCLARDHCRSSPHRSKLETTSTSIISLRLRSACFLWGRGCHLRCSTRRLLHYMPLELFPQHLLDGCLMAKINLWMLYGIWVYQFISIVRLSVYVTSVMSCNPGR